MSRWHSVVRVAGFKPVGAERRSGSIPPSGRYKRRTFLLRTSLAQVSRCFFSRFQGLKSRFLAQFGASKMQKLLLQVRLELTTPACLKSSTVYKYRALTDCATGATCSIIPTNFALLFQPQKIKLKPKKCRLEPKMCHFTIQIAKKDSGLLISDGSDCLKESSWRVKDVSETWIEIYTCLHLES